MSEAEHEGQAQAAETTQEESFLDSIIQETTKYKPSEESYSVVKRGLEDFIGHLMQTEGSAVHQSAVNEMIAQLDEKLSGQINQILHHPEFQKLESTWRSLKYLVDKTDFRENNKIAILNVSKDDLLNDFEDSPEITKSGLYKHVYNAEYGQFGGEPYGAMIGNYEFSHHPQDIKLLQYAGSVATMAHAPFISGTSPKFFGVESFTELPNLKDLKAVFEAPEYAKWQSFRESEDSRYVGLTSPRFMLRLPFGEETVPVKAFNFEEAYGRHEDYLWGNAAFTMAARLTDSFAKYRWCPNIIGPQSGGAVEDLPMHTYKAMGSTEQKIPTEVLLTQRREFELSEEGFMGLTMRKRSDNAAFFSANSCQKPKKFANTKEGKAAETNYKLGTQLPYMFVVSRLSHYIKAIQTENLGSSKERGDIEREMNEWIRQYVADMENPSPGVRARRPLREAQVTVSDVEGDPGWYKVDLKVRPHFKYMGSFFTLSLVGKLDKD